MNSKKNNSILIINYIEEIWNRNKFDKIDEYLHPAFVDHSLPPNLSTDKEGLKTWIITTGKSFEHQSTIEEQVTENDKSIIKFRMILKHIGAWRNLPSTGMVISIVGYRCFRIQDGKIIEHWALIDGNSIENQLKDAARSCKTQN